MKTKWELQIGFLGSVKNLETHFTHMAGKGWLIEKMGVYVNRYKKIEPDKVYFTIDVLPEIGIFDYPENEEAKNYHVLCEDAGWQFVTAYRNIHVFNAGSVDEPLRLHTDNRVQNEAYMTAYRKTERRMNIITFLLYLFIASFPLLFMGAERLTNFEINTVLPVYISLGFSVLILWSLFCLCAGAAWYKKARTAQKHNLPAPVIQTWTHRLSKNLFLIGIFVLIISFVAGAVAEVRNGFPVAFILLGLFLGVAAEIVHLTMWRKINDKKRKRNAKYFYFIGVMFLFIVIMVVAAVAVRVLI